MSRYNWKTGREETESPEVEEWLADRAKHERRWRRRGLVAAIAVVGGVLVGLNYLMADDAEVRDALDGQGMTDVQLGGADGWACDHNDGTSRTFEATNAIGKRVHGVVCCGFVFKGCTVRWTK